MKKTLLFISCLVISYVSIGQPGSLDKSYGNDGKVSDPVTYPMVTNVSALQKDQKLIVVGERGSQFVLKRYLTNGSIDSNFGDNGTAIARFKNINLSGMAGAVVVQPDQKIIVVGAGQTNNYGGSFILARFLPDGLLDSTFGNAGLVINFNENVSTNDVAYAALLQGDGSIVVGGTRSIFFSTDFILKRFSRYGTLDESFGNNGTVITEFGDELQDELTSLVYQPDGKIIAGGYTSEGGNLAYRKFALCRYLPTGQLDIAFGTEGKIISDIRGQGEEINALALQKDGKIVAAGRSNILSYSGIIVAEYNTDGLLNSNFGNQGITEILYDKMYAHCEAVNIQLNNKIVVAGWVAIDLVTQLSDFILARVDSDGSLDSTFGVNAKVSTDFGAYDYCYSSNLQDDGKILCVGQQYSQDGGSETNILLARYIGDPVKQLGPIAKKIRRWIRNHTLQWQPLTDNSVSYYSVQRSSNGVSGFKEIGRIAANNRQPSNVYSYNLNSSSSNSQPPSNYYRVTAVSNEGNNIVSDVIADDDNALTVTVSPNPVKNILKISGLPANQKTVINIVNRSGNVLQSATAQTSSYNFNVAQLKSGVYNVVLSVDNKTKSVKFIKD